MSNRKRSFWKVLMIVSHTWVILYPLHCICTERIPYWPRKMLNLFFLLGTSFLSPPFAIDSSPTKTTTTRLAHTVGCRVHRHNRSCVSSHSAVASLHTNHQTGKSNLWHDGSWVAFGPVSEIVLLWRFITWNVAHRANLHPDQSDAAVLAVTTTAPTNE